MINFGAIVGNTAELSINWLARTIAPMKKFKLALFSLLLGAQHVWAQATEGYESGGTEFDGIIPSADTDNEAVRNLSERIQTGTVEITDILYFIVKLIDLVSMLAGSVCVVMLLYGGFQYMVSGLNDDKEAAKKTFRYAIIGLVITFLAYLVVNLIYAQFTGEGMRWAWE